MLCLVCEEETDEEKIARAGVAWRADENEEEVDATARLAPWMPKAY